MGLKSGKGQTGPNRSVFGRSPRSKSCVPHCCGAARSLGRRVGIEPTTTGSTNRGSAAELTPPWRAEERTDSYRCLRNIYPQPRRRSHPRPSSLLSGSYAVVPCFGYAEDVGIEPTRASRPQLFSRQRPSPALGWVFQESPQPTRGQNSLLWRDLNPRLTHYECAALPTELQSITRERRSHSQWWRRPDSNRRPRGYEPRGLTELPYSAEIPPERRSGATWTVPGSNR